MRTCSENFIFRMSLHKAGWGKGWGLIKQRLKIIRETHFKDRGINEGLTNRVVQLLGKICYFGSAFILIEMVGFFPEFYKKASTAINCRSTSLNYLYLNYAWEMILKQKTFELVFLIVQVFILEVFNATANLETARTTYSFWRLNENFTELKSGDKSLL